MKQLADAILKTAELRESSWQVNSYSLTVGKAAHCICKNNPHMESLVSILLFVCWNDALSWAEKVMREEIK
jgi:hypothetical protein